MIILIVGLLLFFAPHVLRELGLRDVAIDRFGMGPYKGIYSALSLAGLVLIVMGTSTAPFIMVYQPLFQYKFLSHVLMLPAAILVLAGNLPQSHIRDNVGNPMLAGITIWGIAHLWANGDLMSIILFGGFAGWGGFKFYSLRRSGSAQRKAPSLFWDFVAIITGLSLYLGLSTYHGQLFGVGLNYV